MTSKLFDLDIGFETIRGKSAFFVEPVQWTNEHGCFRAQLNRIYEGSVMELEWMIYDIDHEKHFVVRSKRFDVNNAQQCLIFRQHVQNMCLEKRKKRRFW